MKYLLLLCSCIFLFLKSTCAQDYIEFKTGERFNCRVISENTDELVFSVDSMVTQKKVPMFLVKSVNYNKTITDANVSFSPNVKDTSILSIVQGQQYLNDKVIQSNALIIPKIWNGVAISSAVLCLGFAIRYASIEEPQIPVFDFNNIQKTQEQADKYAKEADEYIHKKKNAQNMIYFTGAVAIVSSFISYGTLMTFVKTKNESLSLNHTGNMVSLVYTFK
jgi:hypothetical protein